MMSAFDEFESNFIDSFNSFELVYSSLIHEIDARNRHYNDALHLKNLATKLMAALKSTLSLSDARHLLRAINASSKLKQELATNSELVLINEIP